MLQKNTITGLFFVIGMGLNSPIMLLGATIAVLSALLVARLLQFNANAIYNGLYGFNAALVGAAVLLFLPVNAFSFTLIIFAGAISAVIMNFFLLKLPNYPAFTVPFLLSIWLTLLLSEIVLSETVIIDLKNIHFAINAFDYFYIVMSGIGQVLLQDYWFSGVVFIVGLLLHSFKVAAWAIIGSVGGVAVARVFEFPEDVVHQGLYGFNASLSAIALAQRFTKAPWPIFMGIVVATLLTRFFELLALPALTAPFVLASWLVIYLVKVEPT